MGVKVNIWIAKNRTDFRNKRVYSGTICGVPNMDTVIFLAPGIGGYSIRNIYMAVGDEPMEINLKGNDEENHHPEVDDIYDKEEK